jgi:hypothetical protein
MGRRCSGEQGRVKVGDSVFTESSRQAPPKQISQPHSHCDWARKFVTALLSASMHVSRGIGQLGLTNLTRRCENGMPEVREGVVMKKKEEESEVDL